MDVRLKSLSSFRGVRALALALALSLSSVLGLGFATAVSAQQQMPTPQDLSRTFTQVAKQLKPTVVNIDTVEKASRRSSMRLPEGFPQIPGFGDTPRQQRGTGSGVIISPDGYILTNNHVAGDAAEIKVKLSDGREMKARLVGGDAETDLAVIKIDGQNLPFARLGNSDAVEQGEWVIALGSPFGLQATMTAGIVSATGRDLGGIQGGQFTNFIQTDASINPGNSGGPLINMNGEVIGINTLIFSRTGSNSGIGFAIPSNLANKVYAQLVRHGKVTRGYLGVFLQPVTPVIARTVGLKGEEGALVGDLARQNSPAAQAGLESGDVIVEFDGRPVKNPKHLTEMVADTAVGKSVPLKYFRDGQVRSANIVLGERPGSDEVAENRPERRQEEEVVPGKLGLIVDDVTPELARQMRLRIDSGVVIRSVQPGSAADEAGLTSGDVIHRVNRVLVNSRLEYNRAMSALKDQNTVMLQIERSGQLSFITVTLE
jgi:serine protease Do